MASFTSDCHHRWHMEAAWAKNKEKKVGENNGQLRFRPPPRVVHLSRLDQQTLNLALLIFSMNCTVQFLSNLSGNTNVYLYGQLDIALHTVQVLVFEITLS